MKEQQVENEVVVEEEKQEEVCWAFPGTVHSHTESMHRGTHV